MSDYPQWICDLCGGLYGWVSPKTRVTTYHMPDPSDPTDRCGWCGTGDRPLTEPRDYGYPKMRTT